MIARLLLPVCCSFWLLVVMGACWFGWVYLLCWAFLLVGLGWFMLISTSDACVVELVDFAGGY